METKPYAPSVEGAVNGYAGPRRKVLVVDDNLHNRSLLNTLLEPLGFEVFEAENGLQALEQAQTVRPDVILIDLLMPIMSGFDAVHKLRQMPELNSGKKVVIVATSVQAFGKDIAHAISAGCDAFLIKPIDVQNLLALLKSHLGLEWMYHEPSASGRVVDENLPDLVPPPPEEIAILYDLAMKGELLNLRQRALQIEQLGPQYQPFAAQLRQLAESYDEDKILALIEHYKDFDPANTNSGDL
jgi:CheY-like chemotaxis protein